MKFWLQRGGHLDLGEGVPPRSERGGWHEMRIEVRRNSGAGRGV